MMRAAEPAIRHPRAGGDPAIAWIAWCILAIVLMWCTPTSADDPASTCGNGVLEGGEDCQSCATDCTVRSCTATEPPLGLQVSFTPPPESKPSSVTVRLAYRSDLMSLPGKGGDASIRERVTGLPSNSSAAVNDVGYALRVVVSRPTDIPAGPLFTVSFDRCANAGAPTAGDSACVVEGCGSQAGIVSDCRCTVAVP